MKNYIFILASLMIFSFSSCDKEDLSVTTTGSSIEETENVQLKTVVMETEPNNVKAYADFVAANNRYTGVIGVSGDVDWGYYDVTLDDTDITFELQSDTWYCTAYVYNSLDELVAVIEDNEGDFELLNQPRGRYTFKISGYSNTHYSIDIHF
jgi:hypothetical protein